MQFNISVIQVESTTKPGKTSSYQQLEIAYKNLNDGRVGSKKMAGFDKVEANAFKALVDAKAGDVFTITSNKIGEYWKWESASPQAPGSAAPAPQETKGLSTPSKNSYETSAERAERQVLIVKQSSLSAAVATLTAGAKTPPETDKVLELAQVFANWVFAKPTVPQPTLNEMENDVPY